MLQVDNNSVSFDRQMFMEPYAPLESNLRLSGRDIYRFADALGQLILLIILIYYLPCVFGSTA